MAGHPVDKGTGVHTQVARMKCSSISPSGRTGQPGGAGRTQRSGKTTMTYLIPRLYDPTGGRILIDGPGPAGCDAGLPDSQIGMVTQETYLFLRYDPRQPSVCSEDATSPRKR